MKKQIVAVAAAVLAAGSLAACGDSAYDDRPTYVCPAYGVPGQPGYHPAQPPQTVAPRATRGTSGGSTGGYRPSVKKPPTVKTPTRIGRK